MRFSKLGVVAAFAVADAFLLPPEISAEDSEIIKTLPFEDAVGIDSRIMEISCPGCPVVTDIEGKMHAIQVESMLQLNFSLAHNGDSDQLLLNGLQIYPIDPRTEIFMQPLTASQMIKAADDTWQQAATTTLGYSLKVKHPVPYSSQNQLDLIAINLEIVEVADKFLNGIPTINLVLLETPSGKLMIGSADVLRQQSAEFRPSSKEQECTTILCKWRAIVTDRLSKLKGCGSKARPTIKVHPSAEILPETTAPAHKHHGHHGRPRPHGPHRPHRHHHKHGFARILRGIVMHVFIPILIGVLVGITASLIGMVVGHTAIFIWRLLFRRGTPKYTKIQQVEIVVEDGDDEAKGFLEHQGPPPVYEDVVIVDEKSSE